jgi:hypothetical protein
MVYSEKFVATIKVNGKILRENKEVVALPFGSEYSIYLKNQNTVRAVVRVYINGEDATDGLGLIVGPNQTMELERFVKNQNFNKGNRFKFIERTGAIEEHRGIGIDDGLVRVEYTFEKVQPQPTITWTTNTWPYTTYYNYSICQSGSIGGANDNINLGGLSGTVTTSSSAACNVNNTSYGVSSPRESFTKSSNTRSMGAQNMLRSAQVKQQSMDFQETSLNDAGITVPGSESRQKFSWGSWFPTEDVSHAIVLKLVGKVGQKEVIQPVTVKAKPTCTTCGKVNKANAKFCNQCGTALELL